MTTFHDDAANFAAEAYSRPQRAATAVALAGMLVASLALVLLAREGLRGAAAAASVAALAPLWGCAAAGLASRRASLVAVALAALLSCAASLALGALALGLALAGLGVTALASRAGAGAGAVAPIAIAAAVAALCAGPFLLAGDAGTSADESRALDLAGALFAVSPLAAASSAVGFDLLRSDWLYSISTLGSSRPLGYPSAWIQGAVLAVAGCAALLAARARSRVPLTKPHIAR